MFFVFGPSGQMYRGGPEKLSQVSPVRRVQRPQALRSALPGSSSSSAAADTPSLVREPPTPFSPAAAPAPSPPEPGDGQAQASLPLRVLEAVSAYVQTELGPAEPRQPLTRVRDVMTVGALSVTPELPVHEAWQTLARHQIGQAPVLNAQGFVVGLLLRADLAPAQLLPGREAVREMVALARRTVAEAMVTPVPTVAADTELRRVARVLMDTGLPGLPVTDESGALTGFISRNDILRAVAADPPLDLWT